MANLKDRLAKFWPTHQTADQLVFWFLSAALFLLPVFTLPIYGLPIDAGKKIVFGLLIILAFVAWLIDRFGQGSLTFTRAWLWVAGLGIIAAAAVSALFNGHPLASFLGSGFEKTTVWAWFSLILFAFLLSVSFQTKRRLVSAQIIIVAGAAAVFLFQIIHLIIPILPLPDLLRPASANLIGKWNDLGVFAGYAAVVIMILLETIAAKAKPLKWWLVASLVVSLLFVGLVNFPPIWYLLGLMSLVLFIYFLATETGRRKVLRPVFVILLISIAFIALGGQGQALGNLANNIDSKIGVSVLEVRPNLASTLAVGRDVLKKSPLFGYGPESFSRGWNQFKPASVYLDRYWNIDFTAGSGFIPSLLPMFGLLGAAAWLFFFYFLLWVGYRALFVSDSDDLSTSLVLVTVFGTLYLWVMLWVYISDAAVIGLAFASIGLLVAVAKEVGVLPSLTIKFNINSRLNFISTLIFVILVVASLALGYYLTQQFWSELLFQRGLTAVNTTGDPVAAQTLVGRAVQIAPTDDHFRILAGLGLVRLNQLLASNSGSPDELRAQFQNTFSVSIQAARQATALDSNNYANWLVLGQLYSLLVPLNVSGAYDQALAADARALELNRGNPQILLFMAQLALSNNNPKQARQYLEQAIAVKPDFTDAIFTLAQLEADQGDLAAAIKRAEGATTLVPDNTGAWFGLGFLRYKHNEFSAARDALLQAIKLNPEYANAKYFLGLSYDALGDQVDALATFTDLLKTNPGNTDLTKIIQNLQAGRRALATTPAKETPDKKKKPPLNEN